MNPEESQDVLFLYWNTQSRQVHYEMLIVYKSISQWCSSDIWAIYFVPKYIHLLHHFIVDSDIHAYLYDVILGLMQLRSKLPCYVWLILYLFMLFIFGMPLCPPKIFRRLRNAKTLNNFLDLVSLQWSIKLVSNYSWRAGETPLMP